MPELNGSNASSFLLSNSMRMLKAFGVRAVITLADSSRHVGSVYQNCNFKYYGLTDPKQDMYFTAAWEAGYYDIPKRISLDELAENLGCCKSTLNVTLRAAERNVFELYMAANKSSESSERV